MKTKKEKGKKKAIVWPMQFNFSFFLNKNMIHLVILNKMKTV